MPQSDRSPTWHILTGEYPPDPGGVADYTMTVAEGLVQAGERVHVWTRGDAGTLPGVVTVHRVFGDFGPRDLARAGALLDGCREPARLLVQWVPHAFGRRGVNLPVAMWLYRRSVSRSAPIDVMVHEPFMPFAGSLAHRGAAAVQRLMTSTVLRAASRVFAGTPAWIRFCRSLSPVPFRWTPIPSGIPVVANAQAAREWRSRLGVTRERLVGCFGRAGRFQERAIEQLAADLHERNSDAAVLLIGHGSTGTAGRIVQRRHELREVVRATGPLDHSSVSAALRACDLMVQPYEDGICTRHSSVAALLTHGCAIVSNSGRFTEELWRQSGAIQLAPPDAAALSGAVVGLLADEGERARLSGAAAALYDTTFHVRHTVAALKG
jgi:glycosyltransferase involved in cell wall biosynthesis